MPAPKSNLTLVTPPSSESGETEYWLSDPEKLEDGDGNWGFALYESESEDVWLVTFAYSSEGAAMLARTALIVALQGAVFVATTES